MGKVNFSKFSKYDSNWPDSAYSCSMLGNVSGDYYPAADYEALEAKLAALVNVTDMLLAYYDALLQGWKTDNYAEVIERTQSAINAARRQYEKS